jgi:hypothetical protein
MISPSKLFIQIRKYYFLHSDAEIAIVNFLSGVFGNDRKEVLNVPLI